MMFNTYTMSEQARHSPGLILLRCIVDHYAGQGYRSLDLGIGSDDYKRMFCKDDEPIFDLLHPAQPARQVGYRCDVAHQSHQIYGEAFTGPALPGAKAAKQPSLTLKAFSVLIESEPGFRFLC